MARTRQNPRGLHLPQKAVVVMVGEHGQRTHLYSPAEGDVICKSGRGAGRYAAGADREAVLQERQEQERSFYRVYGRDPKTGKPNKRTPPAITCYRCAKLAGINIANGREPWDGG
jgi:hypothetical protein